MPWKLFVFFIAFVLVACGGGDVRVSEGDNNPPTDPVPDMDLVDSDDPEPILPLLPELNDRLVAAECNTMFRCCSSTQAEQRFGFEDVDSCLEGNTLFSTFLGFEAFRVAVREGRIEFDEGMAELCAASFEGIDCNDFRSDPLDSIASGCPEAITPRTPAGGRCKFQFECIDSFCEIDAGPDDDEGTCVAFQGLEASCEDINQRCEPGLYCESFFSYRCTETKAENAACLDDEECRSGHCASLPNGDRVCLPPPPYCVMD